jgi:hypothetical protein
VTSRLGRIGSLRTNGIAPCPLWRRMNLCSGPSVASVTGYPCGHRHGTHSYRSERWRWDLNPRMSCPITRFRGLRSTVRQGFTPSATCSSSQPVDGGGQCRTGVNETSRPANTFSATSRRRRSRNGPASGTWFTSWNRSALPAGSRSSPTSAPPPHSDTPNDGRRPAHPRDVRGQLPAADPTVGPRFRTPLPAPSRCCTGGCRARARRPAADAVEVRDHQQRRRTTVARCGRSPEARRA